MNEKQQKAAKVFAAKWKGKGDEKQHTQTFWLELLQQVYGIEINDFAVMRYRELCSREHNRFALQSGG